MAFSGTLANSGTVQVKTRVTTVRMQIRATEKSRLPYDTSSSRYPHKMAV